MSAGQVLRAQQELLDGLAWPLAADFTTRVVIAQVRLYPAEGWQIFYPAASAGEFLGILATELCDARIYQVHAGVNTVIRAALQNSSTLSARDTPEPPSLEGLAWFDDPPAMLRRDGSRMTFRALSWSSPVIAFPDGHTEAGVRVTAWKDSLDLDELARKTWISEMGAGSLLLFGQSRVWLRSQQAAVSSSAAWLYGLWLVLGNEEQRKLKAVVPADTPVLRQGKRGEVTIVMTGTGTTGLQVHGRHRLAPPSVVFTPHPQNSSTKIDVCCHPVARRRDRRARSPSAWRSGPAGRARARA